MKNKFLLFIVFSLLIFVQYSYGQKTDTHDTSYYETYPNLFTGRIYLSHKYANIKFQSSGTAEDLEYRGNTKLVTGIGGTYKGITLNLGLGFGFLNNNDDKGKTKSINLQIHAFPKGLTIDLLAIHYKGLYAYPKNYGTFIPNTYYVRPDANFNLVGLAAYKVANAQKFSYNAAMIQSEWQKRSAGSLLYGGGIYYNEIKDDSSLVPSKVASSFSQGSINKFHFLTIGPGIGYAYTLVAIKHLFIMGSVIGNANIYFSADETGSATNKKTSFEPLVIYKAAAGYNGSVWDVSATWAGNAFLVKESNVSKANFLPTGNFRFNVAKRINVKRNK